MGIAKSNEGVFGPFAQRIKDAVSTRMGTALGEVTEPGTQAASDFEESMRSETSEEPESEQKPTINPSPATTN